MGTFSAEGRVFYRSTSQQRRIWPRLSAESLVFSRPNHMDSKDLTVSISTVKDLNPTGRAPCTALPHDVIHKLERT